MKILKFLLILGLGIMILSPCAFASDIAQTQWDSIDTQSLEDAGEGLSLTPDFVLDEAWGRLRENVVQTLQNAIRDATHSAVLLLMIVLFCETGSLFFLQGAFDTTNLVGVLSVAAVAVTDVSSLMSSGMETITLMAEFARLLIPVMTACSAASGQVGAAAARQAATLLFCNVLVTLIERVLMPLVFLFSAALIAAAAVQNDGLNAIAKLLKWMITSSMTLLLTVFTIYLSITNFAAAGADAVTIKLTRTVISGLVPVVGGILSDASETVLAGAALVRSAVGLFGVATIILCCSGPFITLSVRYLAYRLAAVAASLMSHSRCAGLIEEIGASFSLMMGMTGSVALLVMIALFAALSAGVV